MTIQDVIDRVQEIYDGRGDDETAHSMEDNLHVDVLRYIAAGGDNAAGYAAEALRTLEIKFARWCA